MVFKGKRIRQLRELNGLTQLELAAIAGVSQGFIGQIERGLKPPSDDLMRRISEQTRFPIAFFTQDPPVEFPAEALMFRAHAHMKLSRETEARRYAELVAEIALTVKRMIAPAPTTLPALAGKSPEEAATLTRSALGIAQNEPIHNLLKEVERAGVLVLGIPAPLPCRNAFALGWDKQPVLAVVRCASGAQQRLNVAHELGHLVLQHARLSTADEERDALEYVGALLLPAAAMRREITLPVTLSSIALLKSRWMVSIQALVKRAWDLNIINGMRYSYLNEQISAIGWKKEEPGEFAPERPQLLDVKRVSAQQLADELRMDPAFVQDVFNSYSDVEAERQL